jgi:hypothetical protein
MAKRARTSVAGSSLQDLASRLDELDRQRQHLIAQIQTVAARLAGSAAPGAIDVPAADRVRRKGGRPKGYKMSAATRAKLREAWARRKAAAGQPSASAPRTAPKSSRRKISPEGRARIAAAQKKRWAKLKTA